MGGRGEGGREGRGERMWEVRSGRKGRREEVGKNERKGGRERNPPTLLLYDNLGSCVMTNRKQMMLKFFTTVVVT